MGVITRNILFVTCSFNSLQIVIFHNLYFASLLFYANSSHDLPTICVSNANTYFKNVSGKIDKCVHNHGSTMLNTTLPMGATVSNFKQIEFTCAAPFPIEWNFRTPLMDARPLKSLSMTKTRTMSSGHKFRYESTLSLNWMYSKFFYEFECRQIHGEINHNNDNQNTHNINSSSVYRFKYPSPMSKMYRKTYVVLIGEDYYNTKLSLGNSHQLFVQKKTEQCNYRLEFDMLLETKVAYICRGTKGSNVELRAQFAECLSLDECNAIFKHDAYNCTQQLRPHNLECQLNTCVIPVENDISGSGNGIITCGSIGSNSLDNTVVLYYYFRAWKNTIIFPVNEIMKNVALSLKFLKDRIIHITFKDEIYVNEPESVFMCKAPSFLFAKGLLWSYQLKNGSIIEKGYGSEYIDKDMQIVSEINLKIPKTPIWMSVTCHAPLSNSHLWVNFTRPITLKTEWEPKVVSLYESPLQSLETGNIRTLTCKATGSNLKFLWMMNVDKVNLTAYAAASKLLQDSVLRCTKISGCIKIESNENESNVTIEDSYDTARQWKIATAYVTCIAKNNMGNHSISIYLSRTSPFLGYIIGGGCGAIVFILFMIILAVCFIKFKRKYGNLKQLTEAEVNEFLTGDPSSKDPFHLPYNKDYEIPRDKFTIENTLLGEGQSATVKIGKYGSKIVAVKSSNKTADIEVFKALLTELKVLCFVGTHDNIVTFIGASIGNIRKREIYILLEFCSNGSVLEYIRGYRESFIDRYQLQYQSRNSYIVYQNGINKTLSTRHLLLWASQIADGCGFLSSRNVIHGDLAARNIFLTDSLIAKVGDFGLSKQLIQYSVYTRSNSCPLPLKWIAIESLQNQEFSLQSDIWSYGIILWELFSLGDVPYPGIDWNFESYKILKSGYRMDKPPHANQNIYDIMKKCWDETPRFRPTFKFLHSFFDKELQSVTKCDT